MVGLDAVYADLDSEVLKVAGGQAKFFDDITGQPLDPALVAETRKRELEYFREKGGLGAC